MPSKTLNCGSYECVTVIVVLGFITMSPKSQFCCGSRDMSWASSQGDGNTSSYGGSNYTNNNVKVFDVRSFGARANSKNDDTKAFEATWKAACNNPGYSKANIYVPESHQFFIGAVSFTGPCASAIELQIDGVISSTCSPHNSISSKLWQWIYISKVSDFTITGKGAIDGKGKWWWQYEKSVGAQYEDDGYYEEGLWQSIIPTALKFFGSHNVKVEGITIKNSPRFHITFDTCTKVRVKGFTVNSPGNSPNTDGIHLQNSQDVEIHHSNLACGDDCISIQTGCSHVRIHNIQCGPGHGISIGSLGQDGTKACVSNITVQDSIIQNALNGVRIKSWQGGIGTVKDVTFEGIQVENVWKAITIDEFYCGGKSQCGDNKTSAVAVKRVTFQGIRGTFANKAVSLACSDTLPCTDVRLVDIQLKPSINSSLAAKKSPYECWNAFGEYQDPVDIEPLNGQGLECLHSGYPFNFPGGAHSNDHLC